MLLLMLSSSMLFKRAEVVIVLLFLLTCSTFSTPKLLLDTTECSTEDFYRYQPSIFNYIGDNPFVFGSSYRDKDASAWMFTADKDLIHNGIFHLFNLTMSKNVPNPVFLSYYNIIFNFYYINEEDSFIQLLQVPTMKDLGVIKLRPLVIGNKDNILWGPFRYAQPNNLGWNELVKQYHFVSVKLPERVAVGTTLDFLYFNGTADSVRLRFFKLPVSPLPESLNTVYQYSQAYDTISNTLFLTFRQNTFSYITNTTVYSIRPSFEKWQILASHTLSIPDSKIFEHPTQLGFLRNSKKLVFTGTAGSAYCKDPCKTKIYLFSPDLQNVVVYNITDQPYDLIIDEQLEVIWVRTQPLHEIASVCVVPLSGTNIGKQFLGTTPTNQSQYIPDVSFFSDGFMYGKFKFNKLCRIKIGS